MADTTNVNPTPSEPEAAPPPPGPNDRSAGDRDRAPYDANVQLIRRRLADENRMPKPKRWWGLR